MTVEQTCGKCRFFRQKDLDHHSQNDVAGNKGECAKFTPIEICLRQTPFDTHSNWTPNDILNKLPLIKHNHVVAKQLKAGTCFEIKRIN